MAIRGGEAGYCQTMSWQMFCDWTGTIICVIVQIKETQRNKESQLGADAFPWLLIRFCHSYFLFTGPTCSWTWKCSPSHSVSELVLMTEKNQCTCIAPPTLSERVGLIPSIDLWGPELLAKAIIPDLLGSTRFKSFPDSSVGKESACNAEDPSLIPGSGRSTGEGIGYPPRYSWASLVAKLVNNPPTMWETWVRSLGWEDLLEKGKATHFSILTWRISWTLWSMGSQRVKHNWATFIH